MHVIKTVIAAPTDDILAIAAMSKLPLEAIYWTVQKLLVSSSHLHAKTTDLKPSEIPFNGWWWVSVILVHSLSDAQGFLNVLFLPIISPISILISLIAFNSRAFS